MRQHFTTITDVTAHIIALDPMLGYELTEEQLRTICADALYRVRYEEITNDEILDCLYQAYVHAGATPDIAAWMIAANA